VATIRSYRLVSLALLVLAVLGMFLGFFFLWVVAPVIVIGLFYLVFVALEERRSRRNGVVTIRSERRELLSSEAAARGRDVEAERA
jgi:hypothetical protein